MIGNSFRRTAVVRLFLGCLLVLTMPVQANASQPDRLNFGVVHVGARVQGSVRIFVDPKEVKSSEAKVVAPVFVKVDSVKCGTQEYGRGNTKGYCDIAVTIDTSKPGNFSAPLVMSLGEQPVEVPVSADIRPRRQALPRVLVADTPFEKFSTSDAKLFDPWLKLVERGGFDVDYIEVRTAKSVFDGIELAKFDTILLGEMGIIRLTKEDIAALRKYAENGGRVILTANAFFVGTVDKANQVLIPYGLEIKNAEDSAAGAIELGAPHITPCPLTDGVKTLSFHRPSPAVEVGQDRAMVLVSSPKNPAEHFVAFALAGKGEVVSLGVSLWWSWVGKADNAILLQNLLRRRPKLD